MSLDISNLLENIETAKRDLIKAEIEKTAPVEKPSPISNPTGDTYMDVNKTVLSHLEVEFWKTGEFPTERSIVELFSTEDEKITAISILRSDDLVEKLKNRGLPQYDKRSGYQFDPLAVLAANHIADLHDRRSVSAKLKQLGLNTREWNGFLKNPDFRKYFEGLVQERFDGDTSTMAKIGLGKLVGDADLNAIKYFHEMTGEYRQQNEEVFHLQMIISRMMEVLVRFVSPEVLAQVANELEIIDTKELPSG